MTTLPPAGPLPKLLALEIAPGAFAPNLDSQVMLFDPRQLVSQVNSLHAETVVRWHGQEPDNPYAEFSALVCQQHQYNFLLWHEEDIARSKDVSDARIAMVKRAIDGYNQQRNDWIERLDEALIEMLADAGASPAADAKLNTETPGSVIDRLSIMSLRIYHLAEQFERDDVGDDHVQRVSKRLERCRVQHADLSQALVDLLGELRAGVKVLKVYRQMKMYNDPTLNPYLYQNRNRRVA